MTCWRERRSAFLSAILSILDRCAPPPKPSSTQNTLPRCVTTEIPRTSPLHLLSEWAAPPLVLALAKTPCLPTTARNPCPLCRKRENLATRSTQSSPGLKKVSRDSYNETHSVSNLLSNTVDVIVLLTSAASPQHPLCWIYCGGYCYLCEGLSDVVWMTFGFQTEKNTGTKKDRRSRHPRISNTPFTLGSTLSLGSLLWVCTAGKSEHFVIRSVSDCTCLLRLNITSTLGHFDTAPL